MPSSSASRVYGGVTGEERVAERRRRLIEAGLTLFGSRGSGSVRVKDICSEAGLTERYFYESFNDLDALFEAVLEFTTSSLENEIGAAAAASGENSVTRISTALRTSVDLLVKDPRKIQVLFVEALGRGGRAALRRHEFAVRAAENFFKWSGTDAGAFNSSPVETRVKAVALAGAASELVISWAEGFLDVDPTELADYLVGLYWRINLT